MPRPLPGPSRSSVRLSALGAAILFILGLGPNPVPAAPDAPTSEAATTTTPQPDAGRLEAPRVASRASTATPPNEPTAAALTELTDPVALAKKAIADCQARYAKVRDYTCTFQKRERVDGRLTHPHVMDMKARAHPSSVYFKFRTPNKGREAIYVAGKNGGKLLAHDVGIGRLLAGTLNLDPHGPMAMEDCRHPITEAGIGALIETVAGHWAAELTRDESQVAFHPQARVGPRACTMIETVHPAQQPHFLFHKVRLYIDHEHGLPIRFEAFDWPRHPGAPPELVEEYTYLDLRINVGLGEHDFDPNNRSYSFGRF
jgi:hypothetical protein